MAGMFKITMLAIVLTAARTMCNPANMEKREPPGCATETTKSNAFEVFWKNHSKVWTVKSTYIFSYTSYICEREVPSKITPAGLQLTTYFDVRYSFTLNCTFHEKDIMTCALSDNGVHGLHL
uniref:Putative basic tail protein n=1 Tax=Rhipicephalus pulchellus TaxID=72859 RepID=L7M9S6_RHIPC